MIFQQSRIYLRSGIIVYINFAFGLCVVGYFEGSDCMSDGPFLTPREQIEHSISKGITFDNITEVEAEQYLVENNNYFKLRVFRKNFLKS